MSAGEFIPGSAPDRDCTDRAAYGTGSTLDSYIVKTVLPPEDEFPSDVCPPKYHSRAKIDTLNVTNLGSGIIGATAAINTPIDRDWETSLGNSSSGGSTVLMIQESKVDPDPYAALSVQSLSGAEPGTNSPADISCSPY